MSDLNVNTSDTTDVADSLPTTIGPSTDASRGLPSALRSLKRYVAVAMGEEWEVRLSEEQGAFARPFARVMQAGPAAYPSGGGKWLAEMLQPFVVIAYPAAPSSVDGVVLPDDALLAATATADRLVLAFRRGVEYGAPYRVPLFNYDGIANDAPGNWFPRAYMRVSDISTQVFADPDDNLLFSVVCDVRLTWRRLAAAPAGHVLWHDLSVTPSS